MLKKISITNFALIDSIVIDFCNGLNVFSGETGSGKSIVVDALAFVLGGRFDKTAIKSGTSITTVEAIFSDCVLSRTMTVDGKNSYLLNNIKTTAKDIAELRGTLLNIHGQHEHQNLMDKNKHISILDSVADSSEQYLAKLADIFGQKRTILSRINNLGGSEKDRARATDFLTFQIKEIKNAKIVSGELETLQQKRETLKNSKKIFESLAIAKDALGTEAGATNFVGHSLSAIGDIKNFDKDFLNIFDRLSNAKIELDDILSDVEDKLNSFDDLEAESLEKIEERVFEIKALYKKYDATDFDSLQKELALLESKLSDIENSEEQLAMLNRQLGELDKMALLVAKDLSDLRIKTAKIFEENILTGLRQLGMPNAKFEVAFDKKEEPTINGIDDVEFLFSANLGEAVRPLVKVASGGELSRLSLAMRTTAGTSDKVPTIVFDEADAGISGNIALIVAQKMSAISRHRQVLVVSHLPQLAAFSDANYLVQKVEKDNRTKTSVTRIEKDSKVNEVARLIGANMASTYANAHAAEMVKNADEFKNSLT